MESSVSYSVPFFNTVFSLNKSYTKKLFVGLEYDTITKIDCKPIVKLIGNDFIGIKFNIESWQKFTQTFEDINKWFHNDPKHKLLDTKISGNGWSMKFTTSFSQKALEVEEEIIHSSEDRAKKFKRSIVMTMVSFDHLQYFLQKNVDIQLKYLENISKIVSNIISAILDNVFLEITSSHDAQLVLIEKNNIIDFVKNQKKVNNLIDCLEEEEEGDKNVLSRVEKELVFYQIFSTRMNEIVDIFNKKLAYVEKKK